jgi:hypothetical protein
MSVNKPGAVLPGAGYVAGRAAGQMLRRTPAGAAVTAVAVAGGYAALVLTGSLDWVFGALALALVAYGVLIAAVIARGAWFRGR